MNEFELLSRLSPEIERGLVVSIDDNTITVQVKGGHRKIDRTGNTQIVDGEDILIQGSSFIGKVRRQPPGKIFSI